MDTLKLAKIVFPGLRRISGLQAHGKYLKGDISNSVIMKSMNIEMPR